MQSGRDFKNPDKVNFIAIICYASIKCQVPRYHDPRLTLDLLRAIVHHVHRPPTLIVVENNNF